MQVIYILVELRKLMELSNNNSAYQVLNFFSNWVVHSKLSASAVADDIIRMLDGMMDLRCNDTVDMKLEDDIVKFISLERLREDLNAFMKEIGLSTEVCTDSGKWFRFQKKLVGVISDVPLELRPLDIAKAKDRKKPNSTKFVKSIIVKDKSIGEEISTEWHIALHSNPLIEVKDGKAKLRGTRPGSNDSP
jgi:hypothetical protein